MANDSFSNTPRKSKRKSRVATLDELRAILSYDPETGLFHRLVTRGTKHKAGMIAGGVTSHGYINITVDGSHYYGHRLAWLFMTGEWPKDQIDHADGNKTNNRFANLREASTSDNMCNRGPTRRSKSGFRGVSHADDKTTPKRWIASVRKGERLFMKAFITMEEAIAARQIAACEIHGQFARVADIKEGAGT